MNKEDVKRIVREMQNASNADKIIKLLGMIDLMNEEKFQASIMEKGGTPDAIRAYFKMQFDRIKDEEVEILPKEELYVAIDREADIEANRDLQEMVETKKMEEQNKDDLFVLVQNNGNFKLQDREAIMKNKMDRQRNVFERNLKLLEALEAIREVSKKSDGLLKLDLKNMMDLPENEFELQKKLLSRFKLKAMSTKGVEMDRETPEREISLETITREDLEKEDITYAISFKELQSKEWELLSEKFRNQMKEHLKAKDIEVEDREPLSIEDDVLNAIAGKEENQMSGKNKDDDYGQEL